MNSQAFREVLKCLGVEVLKWFAQNGVILWQLPNQSQSLKVERLWRIVVSGWQELVLNCRAAMDYRGF